jgi:hypothetical protein
MEDTGFALANHSTLWIDVADYGDVLSRAVSVLSAARMRLSVYNLPLCVLPEAVRPFAVRSISDWKNAYPEVCSPCDERERCAGFFTTGRPKLSRAIAPIMQMSNRPASALGARTPSGTIESTGPGHRSVCAMRCSFGVPALLAKVPGRRGHDWACWCALLPCDCDVLLRLANEEG